MADYREISQQYAQQGINAAILVNGGAAVALLSQATGLRGAGLADDVAYAMIAWAAGVVTAVATWMLAFLSTRYVDKSERETGLEAAHLKLSDTLMKWGLALVLLSVLLFGVGCSLLACAFLRAGSPT